MVSIKTIQQRIKSVRNTAQITKAMEVVSATKMRKSQASALSARPYALATLDMLKNLLTRTPSVPPLLRARPVAVSCLFLVTSDKGLAGALNATVLRRAEQWMQQKRVHGNNVVAVTVGKKAKEYVKRCNVPLEQSFIGFGDYSRPEDTLPVADHLINGFLLGQWDEVHAVYMNFRTTIVQEPVMRVVLPAAVEDIDRAVHDILPERGRFAEANIQATGTAHYAFEYKFEPSADEILSLLTPLLIRFQIHHLILESNASEHSARMVAMKNASDNAKDLITALTLESNKARQAGITRELTEITAGKEALEG